MRRAVPAAGAVVGFFPVVATPANFSSPPPTGASAGADAGAAFAGLLLAVACVFAAIGVFAAVAVFPASGFFVTIAGATASDASALRGSGQNILHPSSV